MSARNQDPNAKSVMKSASMRTFQCSGYCRRHSKGVPTSAYPHRRTRCAAFSLDHQSMYPAIHMSFVWPVPINFPFQAEHQVAVQPHQSTMVGRGQFERLIGLVRQAFNKSILKVLYLPAPPNFFFFFFFILLLLLFFYFMSCSDGSMPPFARPPII